jgi:hypothetical protein
MRNILAFLAAKSIKPFLISSQRATGNDCLIIVTPVFSSSSTWGAIAGGHRVHPPAFIRFRSLFDICCSYHQTGSDWQADDHVLRRKRNDCVENNEPTKVEIAFEQSSHKPIGSWSFQARRTTGGFVTMSRSSTRTKRAALLHPVGLRAREESREHGTSTCENTRG